MSKIKLNYFFFIFAILLPLVIAPLGILIFWPLVFNPYQLLGVFGSIVFAYVWSFAFMWFIVSYMAMPWLVVIKGDRIVFHRLFRRKLVVDLREVKDVEALTNKVPVKENPWSAANIIFRKKDGGKVYVVGVAHYIVVEMYKVMEKVGIDKWESTRKPTKDELKELVIK